MLVAKIARGKCPCGHDGELFFKADDNWQRPCPSCGQTIHAPGTGPARTYGNRRFGLYEGESFKHGFHPSEVKKARKSMPKVADCIRSDGSVHFEDSKQAHTFEKELDRVLTNAGVPKHPW